MSSQPSAIISCWKGTHALLHHFLQFLWACGSSRIFSSVLFFYLLLAFGHQMVNRKHKTKMIREPADRRQKAGEISKQKVLGSSEYLFVRRSLSYLPPAENDYGQERRLLQGFVWFLPAFWPGQCSLTTLPFPHTNNFFQKRKRNRVWEREDSRQRASAWLMAGMKTNQ